MSELKPCPFCGMKPDINDRDSLYPVGTHWRYDEELELRTYHSHADWREGDGVCYKLCCSEQAGGCGAEMHGDGRQEVIDKWNRRDEPK